MSLIQTTQTILWQHSRWTLRYRESCGFSLSVVVFACFQCKYSAPFYNWSRKGRFFISSIAPTLQDKRITWGDKRTGCQYTQHSVAQWPLSLLTFSYWLVSHFMNTNGTSYLESTLVRECRQSTGVVSSVLGTNSPWYRIPRGQYRLSGRGL